jgi:hypothetical protein
MDKKKDQIIGVVIGCVLSILLISGFVWLLNYVDKNTPPIEIKDITKQVSAISYDERYGTTKIFFSDGWWFYVSGKYELSSGLTYRIVYKETKPYPSIDTIQIVNEEK